jgi:hypothetical protein
MSVLILPFLSPPFKRVFLVSLFLVISIAEILEKENTICGVLTVITTDFTDKQKAPAWLQALRKNRAV